jgi:capsular exopolysaccharide synthesis family protein
MSREGLVERMSKSDSEAGALVTDAIAVPDRAPTTGLPRFLRAVPQAASLPSALETTDPGVSVARYLHALRRRWLISLVIAVPLSAASTVAAWKLQPQLYVARAVLHVKPIDTPLVFATADQDRPGDGDSFESFKRTQRLSLRQNFVIAAALDPAKHEALLKLPVLRRVDNPVEWVEQNLSVTFPEESQLMYVSLTADDPTGLHEIVNSLVDQYYSEVVESERARKFDRLNNLDLAYRNADQEQRARRDNMRKLANRVGHTDKAVLTTVQQNALSQYAGFMNNVMQAKVELIKIQTDINHREGINKVPVDEIIVPESDLNLAMNADGIVRQLELERQRTFALIESTRSNLTYEKSAGKLGEFEKRLDACTQKLETRKVELKIGIAERIRLAAVAEIDDLKRKATTLETLSRQLETEAKKLHDEAKAANQYSLEVEQMSVDINAHQSILDKLREEYERTKVELVPKTKQDQQYQNARIKVWNHASPARPAESKTKVAATIGTGMLTFALPFVLFVFLDASKNRISTGADVTRAVGLSVIGAVPIIPQRVMRRLNGPTKSDQYWRTLLSESVDSIAAVLLQGASPGSSRIIMVSSANAGEGKTTLAAHLAVSVAGAGRHAVLVDFDLRRPALHRVFGASLHPGVNEILRDGQELEATLQVTQVPNLMLLSAGRSCKTGLSGLAVADLKALFASLRAEFELVIVDACPILPVVDTRLIGQHVDAVLLSVLRDVSRTPKLRAACELLDLFGVPILGVVVTGSSEEVYSDGSYEPRPEAQVDSQGASS